MLRRFWDAWRGEVCELPEPEFKGPGFSSESMRLMSHYDSKFSHLLANKAVEIANQGIADARDTEDAMLRIIKPEFHNYFKDTQ